MERIAFWREELQGSRLYDERARDNFSRICAALEANSGASFSAACAGSLRQSGGRLFAHEKTTGEGLQHGHYEQTAQRSSGKTVVVAQDTTELNDTTHRAKTGLGHIGSDKSLRGVLVHTALAVGRDGVPLGVIGQKCWVRADADFAKTARRRQMPIEAKESYKWIEGLRWAERLSEQATQVIVVADREGDVYEYLSAPRRANVSLIVRTAQARRTTEGTDARTVMNAVSAYSMVAWRLMFMTYYARLYPSRPCSEIVSVEEHRALLAKAKGSVQSVGEVVLEIAKLGGYRQSHAPPGVKVIWRGLYALQFLTMGFSLALSQKNMRQG